MTLTYLKQWLKKAFSGSLGLGDFVGSVIGNTATVWVHVDPQWQSTLNDLGWQIPVFALAGAVAWRISVTPFELWKDLKKELDAANARLQANRDPKHDELESWAREFMDPIFKIQLAAYLEYNETAGYDEQERYMQAQGWKGVMRSPADQIAREPNFDEAQRTLCQYLNNAYFECARRMHSAHSDVWHFPSYRVWRLANEDFMVAVRRLALKPGYPVIHQEITQDWGVRQVNEFWPDDPKSSLPHHGSSD